MMASVVPAWGHAGEARAGEAHWWTLWSWDPLILFNLVALTVLYFLGVRKLWGQAGVGRGVSRRHLAAFLLALVSLAAALLSPIDVLATELLWVHMIQHMLLMNVAAPLLILASPLLVTMWVLPAEKRRMVGRWKQRLDRAKVPFYLLWQPVFLWLLFAAVLWIWHLPALYGAALSTEWVHDLQHLSFLVVSCLFWRVLLDPVARLRMSRGLAVLYLFTTSLHTMALGVFMALSPRLWYGAYAGTTENWGLLPLEDQQIAGFLMWMPGCMVYALIAAIVFTIWLRAGEREGTAEMALES
jgi:putative membrane protein